MPPNRELRYVNEVTGGMDKTVQGSVAAIVGNMCLATKDFNIRDEKDRAAVRAAIKEVSQEYFDAIARAREEYGG